MGTPIFTGTGDDIFVRRNGRFITAGTAGDPFTLGGRCATTVITFPVGLGEAMLGMEALACRTGVLLEEGGSAGMECVAEVLDKICWISSAASIAISVLIELAPLLNHDMMNSSS